MIALTRNLNASLSFLTRIGSSGAKHSGHLSRLLLSTSTVDFEQQSICLHEFLIRFLTPRLSAMDHDHEGFLDDLEREMDRFKLRIDYWPEGLRQSLHTENFLVATTFLAMSMMPTESARLRAAMLQTAIFENFSLPMKALMKLQMVSSYLAIDETVLASECLEEIAGSFSSLTCLPEFKVAQAQVLLHQARFEEAASLYASLLICNSSLDPGDLQASLVISLVLSPPSHHRCSRIHKVLAERSPVPFSDVACKMSLKKPIRRFDDVCSSLPERFRRERYLQAAVARHNLWVRAFDADSPLSFVDLSFILGDDYLEEHEEGIALAADMIRDGQISATIDEHARILVFHQPSPALNQTFVLPTSEAVPLVPAETSLKTHSETTHLSQPRLSPSAGPRTFQTPTERNSRASRQSDSVQSQQSMNSNQAGLDLSQSPTRFCPTSPIPAPLPSSGHNMHMNGLELIGSSAGSGKNLREPSSCASISAFSQRAENEHLSPNVSAHSTRTHQETDKQKMNDILSGKTDCLEEQRSAPSTSKKGASKPVNTLSAQGKKSCVAKYKSNDDPSRRAIQELKFGLKLGTRWEEPKVKVNFGELTTPEMILVKRESLIAYLRWRSEGMTIDAKVLDGVISKRKLVGQTSFSKLNPQGAEQCQRVFYKYLLHFQKLSVMALPLTKLKVILFFADAYMHLSPSSKKTYSIYLLNHMAPICQMILPRTIAGMYPTPQELKKITVWRLLMQET